MADGYLESHYAEYEKKKAAWLKKKNSIKCLEHSKKTFNNQQNECRKDTTDPA